MKNFRPEMIIWSADVSADEIKKVVSEKALPEGTIIKLDRLFFENEDKSFIDFCQDHGYPVFCDAKIVEIPDKVIKIAGTYLKHRPFMLNVMAGVCSSGNLTTAGDKQKVDALARFAEVCAEVGTKSCAVTVLTSKNELICYMEFGATPLEQVDRYVSMLELAGLTDIVCSPKEANFIRNKYGKRFSINTPGVRLPNSSLDDQQRVTTPAEAFKNGANRLVIGRDLIRGEGDIVDRVKRNYQRIVDNIGA